MLIKAFVTVQCPKEMTVEISLLSKIGFTSSHIYHTMSVSAHLYFAIHFGPGKDIYETMCVLKINEYSIISLLYIFLFTLEVGRNGA